MTNDQRMVDVELLNRVLGALWIVPNQELKDELIGIIDGPGVEPVETAVESVAAWIESQRNDIPATGAEFAAAIRSEYLAAPSAPVQVVPDWRPEVVALATAMESKLKANDHKGGWSGCAKHWLMMRIVGEAIELLGELKPDAIAKAEFYAASRLLDAAYGELDSFGPHLKTTCDPKRILEEAADIANFAMMLADVSGALEHAPQRPLSEDGGESTAQSSAVACPTGERK